MAIKKENLLFHYNAMFNVSDSEHDNATETWYDLSGQGNHGKIIDGIWENNCLILDGSTSWINTGQYALSDEVTMEILFSPSVIRNMRIFDNDKQGGGIFSEIDNGKFSGGAWYRNVSSGSKKISFDISINELVYVTLTVKNNALRVYKNGIQQGGEQYPATGYNFILNAATTPYCLAIGANATSSTGVNSNNKFRGKIYSARLYNVALTDSEIYDNFKADKAMFDIVDLQSVGNVSKIRIGQEQIYDLKDIYSRNNRLSKTEDDTAFGLINFTKGVQINKAKITYDEFNNIVTFT